MISEQSLTGIRVSVRNMFKTQKKNKINKNISEFFLPKIAIYIPVKNIPNVENFVAVYF